MRKTHQKNVNWNKKEVEKKNIKNFTFQFRLGNLTLLYASIATTKKNHLMPFLSPPWKKNVYSHLLSSPEGTFANVKRRKKENWLKKVEKDIRKGKVENGIFIIINLPSIEHFECFSFVRKSEMATKIHRNVICFVAESTIDTIFFLTYLFFIPCHLIDGAATNNSNFPISYPTPPQSNDA